MIDRVVARLLMAVNAVLRRLAERVRGSRRPAGGPLRPGSSILAYRVHPDDPEAELVIYPDGTSEHVRLEVDRRP